MAGGYECKKCRKIVQVRMQYFFRAHFADCHDMIEVGFSRDVAAALMGGIDAETFKSKYTTSKEIEDFIAGNVLYKSIKLTVKRKEEKFLGETRQRFYAFAVQYLTEKDSQEIVESN